METPIPYLELPARCIIVSQHGWVFAVEVLHKRNQLRAITCTTISELTGFINDWQLRQAGPVYRRLPQSWQFVPLSYEQAAELVRAELTTT